MSERAVREMSRLRPEPDWSWTDSHCHLQDLDDYDGAVDRMQKARVKTLICVGTSDESSRLAVELAQRSSLPDGGGAIRMFSTIGLHPHDAIQGLAPIEQLLASEAEAHVGSSVEPGAVVAVGECGLDYYYDYSPRETQREVFAAQIALANQYGLSLVVHTRDAWDDTVDILAGEERPDRVIIHCFSGGPEDARRCLDLGAYLSFSGIVTFKNAEEIREAAALCPGDRLLVETDAPYLAPVPHRGSRNEPAYVSLIGEAMANLRGVSAEAFAMDTTANASEAFGFER